MVPTAAVDRRLSSDGRETVCGRRDDGGSASVFGAGAVYFFVAGGWSSCADSAKGVGSLRFKSGVSIIEWTDKMALL